MELSHPRFGNQLFSGSVPDFPGGLQVYVGVITNELTKLSHPNSFPVIFSLLHALHVTCC